MERQAFKRLTSVSAAFLLFLNLGCKGQPTQGSLTHKPRHPWYNKYRDSGGLNFRKQRRSPRSCESWASLSCPPSPTLGGQALINSRSLVARKQFLPGNGNGSNAVGNPEIREHQYRSPNLVRNCERKTAAGNACGENSKVGTSVSSWGGGAGKRGAG